MRGTKERRWSTGGRTDVLDDNRVGLRAPWNEDEDGPCAHIAMTMKQTFEPKRDPIRRARKNVGIWKAVGPSADKLYSGVARG